MLARKIGAAATMILGLALPTETMAQIRFQGGFDAAVDCTRPLAVSGVTVHGDASGTLNPDKTATADLDIRTFMSSRIHFEGRLGRILPAPGGSGQVNVVGKNHLRLIWHLPNNDLLVDITISGRSCTARLDTRLKRGFTEYSLYDGSRFFYCGKPRVVSTSCRVS
jgi:hypothetical protein